MFCREQVAQLRDEVPNIRARGAELVVVGNGQPFHAQDFLEHYDFDFPLLVDPDLEAFAAAGLHRSRASTLGLAAIKNGTRALMAGFRQGKTKGDPWQQGGVFVIHPPAEERFAYISRAAGDHPDPALFLAAL